MNLPGSCRPRATGEGDKVTLSGTPEQGSSALEQEAQSPGLAEAVCSALLERVQRDEGGRGIGAFTSPVDPDLAAAATGLVNSQGKVCILTGFPCLLEHTPPTETDGPPGALAVARACSALGREVLLLTDEANAKVVGAALDTSCLPPSLQGTSGAGTVNLMSFPPLGHWNDGVEEKLMEVTRDATSVVSVERPGPGVDGVCYTMRGIDMSGVLAPLHRVLEVCKRSRGTSGCLTIGIGDGGNEVGMGKVLQEVLSSSLPMAEKVACCLGCDRLIVCSVSNWGGYALASAMAVMAVREKRFRDNQEAVHRMVPAVEVEERMLQAMVEAGARDGITGKRTMSVDGMPVSVSLGVLEDLRAVVLRGAEPSTYQVARPGP